MMTSYLRNQKLQILQFFLYGSSLFSISVNASPVINQTELSFTSQLITEAPFGLAILLLILLFTYFYFKTIISRTIILLITTACISLGVNSIIEKFDFNSFLDQQHLNVMAKTSNIRSRLESLIQTDLEISNSLIIYMKSKNFQFSTGEFNALAQSILDTDSRIRHIAVAENLIVNHVYPLEGNRKAIGLDYQKNTEQWPQIERAINSNKVLLAGPVNLVQGGTAFIGRLPVYRTMKAVQDIDNLWGLVSVIIDMEALFQAAGLYADTGLNIAIRGSDALGQQGAVFFGNKDIFQQQPILQNIKLPEGNWQIATTPISGWPISSPAQYTIRLSVLSFYLLVVFFIIFRASQHHKLHKEMEERKRSEDRYRQLFEHSNNGIFLITDDVISDCNKQLVEMLGLSREQILDHSWPEISSAIQVNNLAAVDHYNKLITSPAESTKDDETLFTEWTHKKTSGETVILEIYFTPIHTMEKPTLLVTCKDISLRKHLEYEQRQLNKKLNHSQKLKAIGQLTGGVAHDFNNILTAISGYAQLAKVHLNQDSQSEKLPHFLDEVIKAGDRAKNLVQQLLVFSRGQDINYQPISPASITKETVQMLQSTIPTSINLITNYSDTTSKIKSDPTQFQQIVLNLIVNSRDAIVDQVGEIHISLEKINLAEQFCSSCSDTISGQYLQLTIADNGCGIAKEHIERVFEPFYSAKKLREGTGMGLSVVHGIVHAANGHIILESEPDKGTTIKLMFPILDSSEDVKELPARPENIVVKKISGHVLIVDDETAITELFCDVLTNMEMQCSTFNDPLKALEFFQQQGADITLVITDETMPSMKGSELAQKIRQLNSDVPIILCSGYSDSITERDSMALGVNKFLHKPVDLSTLSDAIHRLHS